MTFAEYQLHTVCLVVPPLFFSVPLKDKMEFYCYNKTIAESTTGEGGFMKKEDESQGR